MKKFFSKELIILLFCILTFISIRSIYFPYHFNFSSDQGNFASKSLELWKSKKIELVGPSISFHLENRYLFQGSATYYMMLLFLIPGKFDPIISSYLFMLFCSFMTIPLYYGTKKLVNKKTAFLICILYALLPLYIDYTTFFWNPTLQFSLTPFLILSLGLYIQYRKILFTFSSGLIAGFLLLFHYQFVIIIIGLILFHIFVLRIRWKEALMLLGGLIVGFSPMIIFELRNQFYNTQTLFLFLTHLNKIVINSGGNSSYTHYFLSISLFVIIFIIYLVKKYLNTKIIIGIYLFLLISTLFLYGQKPTHAFGMAQNWNYTDEQKVHTIITSQNTKKFNIVNLIYDTTAQVQKYLLQKDTISINYEDYYHNEYLYVISNSSNFSKNKSYEIVTFKPYEIITTWKINQKYNLYLLKRITIT